MVRPYAVKGLKRKRKELVDDHQDAHEVKYNEDRITEQRERKENDYGQELSGIPVLPQNQSIQGGVTFVLEKASLEFAKVGKTYQLLNADDHANFLRKHHRDPAAFRPDIIQQALLMILDSPLNKAGRVRAIYVRTEKGVLFEVKPYVRLPRTFRRFCGLMLQLLQKLSTSASGDKGGKLLRVIKNPVTNYLPVGSHKIGLSYSSEKLVDLRDYVAAARDCVDLVFVVGAMAHGKVDGTYTDDFISMSGYPLSAACCIARICTVLEQKWQIL